MWHVSGYCEMLQRSLIPSSRRSGLLWSSRVTGIAMGEIVSRFRCAGLAGFRGVYM